ncbi:hypothetical protein ACFIOY_16075 [Bradyrhizobium sp. TZ2]
MKAALNYDNLINADVEKRRLQFSFDKLIVSPEMKEIGVGDVKDDRMARAIGIRRRLPARPRARALGDFLARVSPPRAERELKIYGELTPLVIARSKATKQSILSFRGAMDCFAALAMTVRAPRPDLKVTCMSGEVTANALFSGPDRGPLENAGAAA